MMIGCIMWPVSCSQGFFIFWPTDLVFDPTWLIFELDWDIIKMIILTLHVPYFNLTEILSIWSFWPYMYHISTWLRYYQDDHSEQVWWILDQNCGLWNVHNIFSMIWPTNLVFDPTWSIFQSDRDFIKTNILTYFYENWMNNVACNVFTRFSYNLTYWPSFWPNMTHIQTWPRFHQSKHSDKFSRWLAA